MVNSQFFDVAVIGGGPSGSTAARLLAAWGHSVILLAGPKATKPSLAESLPPSIRKLFSFLEILDPIDQAEFYRTSGNTARWGDPREHSERFSGPAAAWGYQVLRRDFDRLLLRLAGPAGVQVCPGAIVRRVDLKHGEQSTLEYSPTNGDHKRVAARFILDCSGRAGVIARQGFRTKHPERNTLALAAVWQKKAGWGLEDETHTLVESYRDGWAWSIPLSPVRRYFTVMVDWRDIQTTRREGLNILYRTELDKTIRFKSLLKGGALTKGPWGCDASLYSARCFAADNFLLVGDAASFIDPLSSFGVKKAMASAWVAAVAINTSLTRSELRGVALDFYSDRERQVFAGYLRQSEAYCRQAALQYPNRFWLERSNSADDISPWETDEEVLKRDPKVLAAFDALKKSPYIRLRRAPEVRIEQRAGILGREVVLQDAVVNSEIPAGIRFLGGIEVPKLVEIVGNYKQVPNLFEAYNRRCPSVALPDFLGALSFLLAKRILVNQQERSQEPESRSQNSKEW
jgi:flavin-dependent dehydrogenase